MSSSFTPLTLSRFTPHVHTSFAVSEGAGVVLELVEAVALDTRAPNEQQFSLSFRGPAHTVLQQATHTLEHAVIGVLAIFLVPVGRDASGVQYQAIFN